MGMNSWVVKERVAYVVAIMMIIAFSIGIVISIVEFYKDLHLTKDCRQKKGNEDSYIEYVGDKVNCCSSEVILIKDTWIKAEKCEAMR